MADIFNRDCIIGMQELQNETADALITDPPYNIARDNNFKTMGRAGIDFGEWTTIWIRKNLMAPYSYK